MIGITGSFKSAYKEMETKKYDAVIIMYSDHSYDVIPRGHLTDISWCNRHEKRHIIGDKNLTSYQVGLNKIKQIEARFEV